VQIKGGGGVLSMGKGTALFDGVAISGTEAEVRVGRPGCVVGRVSADGVRGRLQLAWQRRLCAVQRRGAQDVGGVVRMLDGAVTFKGGSISNSKATVRAPSASCASPRRGMVCCAARHGRWMGARRGARMLRRVVYGVRRMRPAWRVLCMLHHHVASMRVASVHRRE
jgi:hypothetical protein